MAAGEDHTITERVELSVQDAGKIEQEDEIKYDPHTRRIRRHDGHSSEQRTGGIL